MTRIQKAFDRIFKGDLKGLLMPKEDLVECDDCHTLQLASGIKRHNCLVRHRREKGGKDIQG